MKKSLTSHLRAGKRIRLIAALAVCIASCGAPEDIALPPKVAPPPPPPPSPPPPVASPIDAAIPSIVPPNLPQRALCTVGTCTLDNPVPESLLTHLPTDGPVLIWEQRLGRKSRVIFPADKEVELAGVVLEGNVTLLPREQAWGAPLATLKQWQGFHAPGAGAVLATADRNPARIALVIALVPTSADASLAGHVARWRKGRKPFLWKKREQPIVSFDFASRPTVTWGDGAYHARIGWEVSVAAGGSPEVASGTSSAALPAMALSLLRFSPDAGMKGHIHDKERECLAILEGEGELRLWHEQPDSGQIHDQESVAVEPGMVACIPNRMWHGIKPAGRSPFLALLVHAPPGPELHLKELAGKVP